MKSMSGIKSADIKGLYQKAPAGIPFNRTNLVTFTGTLNALIRDPDVSQSEKDKEGMTGV